jgi:ABC-type uncharacterized transport system YnjBCD ATPase subunit
MAHQYIFQMYRLSKVYPPDKTVLNDITLAFLPGRQDRRARLQRRGQVDGPAHHGRASTPRSAATRSSLRARPSACSSRSPISTRARTCAGNVEDGVAETRALLDRFNELAANYSDETADEFAAAQARIDAPTHGTSTPTSSTRWTRCACRRPTPTSRGSPAASAAASRSAGCCSARPDLLLLDEPTNHLDAESVAWLERHLADYKGTVVAVTHDRYFLDNVAGWILELDRSRGIPYEGNYSSWLEQKQKRLAQEEKTEKARQRTIAAELDWVRQNPKGRQTKQKARLQNFEALVAQERNVKLDEVQIHIPTSTHLGNVVVEAENLRKGYGDNLLIEDLSFSLPPGRHRGRHRCQRRRQDDALPHDHRPGAARRRARCASARRCRCPTSTSRATRSIPTRRCGRRSPPGWSRSRSATAG